MKMEKKKLIKETPVCEICAEKVDVECFYNNKGFMICDSCYQDFEEAHINLRKRKQNNRKMAKKIFNPEIDEHNYIECNCDKCMKEHIEWKRKTGRLPKEQREKIE